MFARSCADYSELINGLRDRATALELSRLAIDERAGFHDGYAGKLLAAAPARIFGPVSLGPTLETLGLCILLVEDTLATSRTIAKRTPVDASNQRMKNKNARKRSLTVETVESIAIAKIAAPRKPPPPVSRAHLRVIQQSKGGRKYG
jgi:hypothetical protein